MNEHARRALQVETEFLAGFRSNFDQTKERLLPGLNWKPVDHDDEPSVRAMLARHHRHERELLRQMPCNRRVEMHGFRRHWLFWRKRTGVTMASVLAPIERLASGEPGDLPPVDLGELVDHVRKLAGNPTEPHVIGVCSPTGFTDEVRNSQLDLPNVTVVLVEPGSAGGWRVSGLGDEMPEPLLALFDPEATSQKLERVRTEISERGADLLVGGISAAAMAARLDLPEKLVSQAFELTAAADPELRLSRKSGEVLLYRGAPAKTAEKTGMSMIDRIRAMFDREGDEAGKINLLAERRAGLTQRRDRIYEDIGKLEEREAKLLEDGRQTSSQIARRRMASQLAQLRKDIARQNTTANMLNQQINIISTDIHNLTLIQQGQMAELPDTEELTENAVKAEEMLETLRADADMVASLETGLGEVVTSDEELAILQEFEAPEKAEPASRAGTAPQAERAADPAEPESPPEEKSRRPTADPEG